MKYIVIIIHGLAFVLNLLDENWGVAAWVAIATVWAFNDKLE